MIKHIIPYEIFLDNTASRDEHIIIVKEEPASTLHPPNSAGTLIKIIPS